MLSCAGLPDLVREEVSGDPDTPMRRDLEHFRALYAERHSQLKEEIRRLNERMDKGEEKTDERHESNKQEIAQLKEAFGGFKVKLGLITSVSTSVMILVAQILMKKLGLL